MAVRQDARSGLPRSGPARRARRRGHAASAAAQAASQGGMPWPSIAPTSPASTSPAPAVASQGGALSLIAARPSGAAMTVSAPFSSTTAADPGRRRAGGGQLVVAHRAEQAGELALMRRQHGAAAQARPARRRRRPSASASATTCAPGRSSAGIAARAASGAEARAADPDLAPLVLQQLRQLGLGHDQPGLAGAIDVGAAQGGDASPARPRPGARPTRPAGPPRSWRRRPAP